MMTTNIKIEGMSCQGCVRSLDKALSGLSSLELNQVSIGNAEVTFDEKKLSVEELKTAIEDIGFSVVEIN